MRKPLDLFTRLGPQRILVKRNFNFRRGPMRGLLSDPVHARQRVRAARGGVPA
jgi:hypothetical protein